MAEGGRLGAGLRDGSVYLTTLLLAVLGVRVVEYFSPAARVLGESAANALGLAIIAIAVLAWVPYHPSSRWDGLSIAFFLLVVALWAGISFLSIYRHDVVDMAMVAVPVAIGLLLVKRPSAHAVRVAVDVLAWGTVVLMLGVLVLQLLGVLDRATAGSALDFDREHYWLPLSDLFGIDGRWIGPLRWPNVTASAAVLLVVYGAARGWRERIAFIGTGVLVLLLTGTRSSMIAALAGVVVLVLCTRRRTVAGVPKPVAVVAVAVLGFAYLAVWLVRNPTLTGRTESWPTYFELWRTSPWIGTGDAGIGLAVIDGRLQSWANTGTSIFVDPLTRYGIVTFAFVVAVLTIAALIGWRAMRRGDPTGLAIVAALVVGGLTETLFDWRYLSFQVQMVIVAVLLASRAPRQNLSNEQPD